jgi:hypothetical protein
MTKFQKGDRVRLLVPDNNAVPGDEGEMENGGIRYKTGENEGLLCQHFDNWELISSQYTMTLNTLTTGEELVLNPEAVALRKVGLINSSASVNGEKLCNMLFKLFYTELAAMAKDEVAKEDAAAKKAAR